MIPQKQKQFLSVLATLLAKMAKVDGVVTGDEVAVAGAIWQRLGLTPEQGLFCTEEFKAATDRAGDLQQYAGEYVSTSYGSSTRSLLYELLWEVACADGVLHRNESRALKDLISWLNVRKESYAIYYSKYVTCSGRVIDEEVEEQKRLQAEAERRREAKERQVAEERARKAKEEIARKAREAAREFERKQREKMEKEAARREAERKRRQQQEEDERNRRERERRAREDAYKRTPIGRAYAILGCSKDDTDDMVKRAYRTLARKNHPDVMAREGVSPEIIAQCTTRMAEINNAWEAVKKARGL